MAISPARVRCLGVLLVDIAGENNTISRGRINADMMAALTRVARLDPPELDVQPSDRQLAQKGYLDSQSSVKNSGFTLERFELRQ